LRHLDFVTFCFMYFTSTDILYGLAGIVLAICIASGIWIPVQRRRMTDHEEPLRQLPHHQWIGEIRPDQHSIEQDSIDPDPETTGRHHLPDSLLHGATYRLSADRVARAKVRSPRT
jgi:hypothetical protein